MLFLFRINLDPVQRGGIVITKTPRFKPYDEEDEDEDKKKKREEILFMYPHNI